MNYALLVRRHQRLGEWNREIEDASQRQPSGHDVPAETLTLHQLHRDETDAVFLFDGIEHHDVRMVEPGHRARLALEPGQAVGITRHRIGKHLERHLASEPRVAGAIDLAHAARAEGRENCVGAEAGTWGQGHGANLTGRGSQSL